MNPRDFAEPCFKSMEITTTLVELADIGLRGPSASRCPIFECRLLQMRRNAEAIIEWVDEQFADWKQRNMSVVDAANELVKNAE